MQSPMIVPFSSATNAVLRSVPYDRSSRAAAASGSPPEGMLPGDANSHGARSHNCIDVARLQLADRCNREQRVHGVVCADLEAVLARGSNTTAICAPALSLKNVR